MLSVTGSYGIPVLVGNERDFCFQRHIALIRSNMVERGYLLHYLRSHEAKKYFDSVATGTAQKTVSLERLREMWIPLPPLVEQRRIVSRFEELASLCDSIDENSISFDALARAAKSRILNLAIRGDLIPQNPADEPASVLLDRIRSTADKPPCPNRMSESFESPFPIPDTWEWTTIREINEYERKTLQPDPGSEEVFELYSVPVFESGLPEFVKGTEISSPKQVVRKGDVLVCKINPRINRVWNVAGHTDSRLLASSEWIVVRAKDIVSGYLKIVFQSPYFRAKLLTNVSGVGGSLMRAQAGFVMDYPFPIPPLAEQRRIVAKVEELFSAIDAMATK